jgi:hypothetical protein
MLAPAGAISYYNIHGWETEQNIKKAKDIYNFLGGGNGRPRREPSTYEQMARPSLAVGDEAGVKTRNEVCNLVQSP